MNRMIMDRVISKATVNVQRDGGPFAAAIVKDKKVISFGVNKVTKNNDPTAHAEVNAIKKACKKLNTFDLSGCILYSSCRPCPMCLSATIWANIDKVYYSAESDEAENVGFRDKDIYDYFEDKNQIIKCNRLRTEQTLNPFFEWKKKEVKTKY